MLQVVEKQSQTKAVLQVLMDTMVTVKTGKTREFETVKNGEKGEALTAYQAGVWTALRDYKGSHRPARQRKRSQGEAGASLAYAGRSLTGA